MALRLIEAPTDIPVSVAEIKAHAGISTSADDALLGSLILAAVGDAENRTRRQLCPATWELILDEFPKTPCKHRKRRYEISVQDVKVAAIEIPMPPLVDVVSIKYTDTDGVEQTMMSGAYVVDQDSLPGRVYPAYGTSWPGTLDAPGAVVVRFSCGWAMDDTASPPAWEGPDDIKTWIKVRVATLYGLREHVVIGQTVSEAQRSFVDCLLDRHTVPMVE